MKILRAVCLFVILSTITLGVACTTVSVEIPSSDVVIRYSYPMFQEKYFSYEKTSGTLLIEFKSKSDPLVESIKLVNKLASTTSP